MERVREIAGATAAEEAGLLALNNAHAVELSWLDAGRFRRMVGAAFLARRVGAESALLLAFDQDAAYDSPNFLWFRARYARFVYVDRVVVAARARGRGYARRLYGEVFARAAAAGHEVVTCEVNSEPPNGASETLHAALGFAEVGAGAFGAKRVRYLACAVR
ncbi:MAG: GNAT family N-acetyltransferase [Acetobacteraceae bacterium]